MSTKLNPHLNYKYPSQLFYFPKRDIPTKHFSFSPKFSLLSHDTQTPPIPGGAPPEAAVAVESDFVVILAALLCALICVVGLVAIARCAWLRRPPASIGGGVGVTL